MIRPSVLGLFLLAALLQSGAAPATAGADSSWRVGATLGSTGRESGGPEIAVAPDGEAIATWVGGRRKGVQVATRRPGGGWSAPITLAPGREEVEGPYLAAAAGKAVIVWSDNIRTRNGTMTQVIFAATRLRGKGWSKPRNISAERRWFYEPEGEEPQVTMTRGGKAIVIWTAGDEGHSTTPFIRSATQAPGSTSWTAPVGLPGSIEGEAPRVGATPAGETVAIWGATYDDESGLEAASRPAKGRWRWARRLVNPGAYPEPQLAITSRGEAIAAWITEGEETFEAVLQVATRTSGGKWRVRTLAPRSYAASPQIVTEPGGRAKVVWVRGASFEEQEILAATHSPRGGWTQPMGLTAKELQPPIETPLELEVTGAGESIAMWATPGALGEGLTIRASSKPRGRSWSEPAEVFTSPAPSYGDPYLQVAVAPNGEALALWRCFEGTRWVIKAAVRRKP